MPKHQIIKRDAVILACSHGKKEHSGPAITVYDGLFYRVMRRHLYNVGLFILSVKYGLISADEIIDPYDFSMTYAQANVLKPQVEQQYGVKIDDGYRFVYAILPDLYWSVIAPIAQKRQILRLGVNQLPAQRLAIINFICSTSPFNKVKGAPKPNWVIAMENFKDGQK